MGTNLSLLAFTNSDLTCVSLARIQLSTLQIQLSGISNNCNCPHEDGMNWIDNSSAFLTVFPPRTNGPLTSRNLRLSDSLDSEISESQEQDIYMLLSRGKNCFCSTIFEMNEICTANDSTLRTTCLPQNTMNLAT